MSIGNSDFNYYKEQMHDFLNNPAKLPFGTFPSIHDNKATPKESMLFEQEFKLIAIQKQMEEQKKELLRHKEEINTISNDVLEKIKETQKELEKTKYDMNKVEGKIIVQIISIMALFFTVFISINIGKGIFNKDIITLVPNKPLFNLYIAGILFIVFIIIILDLLYKMIQEILSNYQFLQSNKNESTQNIALRKIFNIIALFGLIYFIYIIGKALYYL